MDMLASRVAELRARLAASGVAASLARRRRVLRRRWAPVRVRVRRSWAGVLQALGPVLALLAGLRSAGRTVAAALRPGTAPIAYRDGMVTLDGAGIVISRYYLPFGRRRIPYERVLGIHEVPLTGGLRFRVHGWSPPRRWLHRDPRRGERAFGLELRTGALLRPVITPVDALRVRALLRTRVGAAAATER